MRDRCIELKQRIARELALGHVTLAAELIDNLISIRIAQTLKLVPGWPRAPKECTED